MRAKPRHIFIVCAVLITCGVAIWLWCDTSFSIYGKVVDEKGIPIANATVSIGLADRGWETGSNLTEKTDEHGLFSLRGIHALGFSARAIKDGYYTFDKSRANRNVAVPSTQDIPQPTKDMPMILMLHKQGQIARLLSVETGQIDVPSTGEPIEIDLTNGRVGVGDLQIEAWIGEAARQRFDWHYRLSIAGGGLLARTDEFDFEAPVDGYQKSLDYSMLSTELKWSSSGRKDYFARLGNGKFARLSINFYPAQRRNFLVMKIHVNPIVGDRNLEIGPKLQVQRF